MKRQSKDLKMTTETEGTKNFWRKEWRDLEEKQRKTEVELETAIDAFDNDPDIQALLGRDFGAIRLDKRKIEEKGEKSSESTWQQVSRFRQVVAEVTAKKPSATRSQEIQGLVAEVFAGIDAEEERWDSELREFLKDEKEVVALQRDLKEGDKVKGFDLEENMDFDLLVDFSKYSQYIGNQEQAMLDDYYSSCQMLIEKRDLEIHSIEQNDVDYALNSFTILYGISTTSLTTFVRPTRLGRGSVRRRARLESF